MTKNFRSFVFSMLALALAITALIAPATAAPAAKTLTGVTEVSAGYGHTCAVAKKRAYCWGSNYGQLGDRTVTESRVPVRVYGFGSNVQSIVAAGAASCASTGAELKCWGETNGPGGYSSTPNSVRGVEGPVKAFSLADGTYIGSPNGLCVIFRSELGCGRFAAGEDLTSVEGLGGAPTAVAAGVPNCAIVAGAAKCWGGKFDGSGPSFVGPTVLPGLGQNVTAIASATQHGCVVVNAAAKCWGAQWGMPSPIPNSDVPVDVPGLDSGVTAIAAGGQFSCAIVNGGVRCWGWGYGGALGNGTLQSTATPVAVAGLSEGVTAIAAGGMHACAIASGKLKCWGSNGLGQRGNGRRGDNVNVDRNIPTTVLAPGRTIRVRGHHQSAAGVDVGYDGGGVSVSFTYPVPAHMWVKDACKGRALVSLSGNGFKTESGRARFSYSNLACHAHLAFGARPAKHEDVVVRASSKGFRELKPFRFRKTVKYFQCWSSDCP